MRYHLFGIGFEGFDIDKHLVGVTTQDASVKGQYIVKSISDVAFHYDGKISVLVELLPDDEHLPVTAPHEEEYVLPTPPSAEEIPY